MNYNYCYDANKQLCNNYEKNAPMTKLRGLPFNASIPLKKRSSVICKDLQRI